MKKKYCEHTEFKNRGLTVKPKKLLVEAIWFLFQIEAIYK